DGLVNGKPAVLLIVWRQPGANIIDTVNRVRAIVPQLQAEIPPTIDLAIALDRTETIRASVHDVQLTLGLSILLVILVVFAFLPSAPTAIIPSVVVPAQQDRGLETSLVLARSTASRLGISTAMIDDTLYDAFGQRQVSTMYTPLNQYHVV